MGLKPATRTKAFMSLVKTLYYEATWLVIPLPENGVKIYKKRWKEKFRIPVRWENKWKRNSNNQTRVFECQYVHKGLCMRTQGLNIHTQFGSCILLNWRIWMGMHEYRHRSKYAYAWIQATYVDPIHVHAWTQIESFLRQFSHVLIKIHPKHAFNPFKVSIFHSKTQAFTCPKAYWNGRSKQNLKMRKVWKTYQSRTCTL